MDSILSSAIQNTQESEISYCKFLSPNDTKSTKAHQSGYLISKSAWKMFLKTEPQKAEIIKVDLTIKWQDDFETNSVFTFYPSKNEFRITNFGRGFPFREENNVGDLLIICKISEHYFKAFILSHDEEIEDFLEAVNITATETNSLIKKHYEEIKENKLLECFNHFIKSLKVPFPATIDLANAARTCYINCASKSNNITISNPDDIIVANPDREILNWLDAEFQLFKLIENDRYQDIIKNVFTSVEQLVETSNMILNRRKSRAGKSLEHHLTKVFNTFNISFSTEKPTENYNKPDFIFPSIHAYRDPKFETKKLLMLAAKTTCKDRWRQIIQEADRIERKHLFTLQQGISKNQLEEMYRNNVCLVVPKAYLRHFPEEFQNKIISLQDFTNIALELQS
jgi:hypothetical protein